MSKCQVKLLTGADCELAVAFYPMFAYDASSGTGLGTLQPLDEGRVSMAFDPATIDIPALDFRTTKVLGLPIPPPLKIAINASELKVLVCTTVLQHRACEVPCAFSNAPALLSSPYRNAVEARSVEIDVYCYGKVVDQSQTLC